MGHCRGAWSGSAVLPLLLASACGGVIDEGPAAPPSPTRTQHSGNDAFEFEDDAGPGEVPLPPDDPDFPPLPPPRAGDWRTARSEPGQTLGEYRAACRNRITEDRRSVVLQPLGDVGERHGALLEKARTYVGAFFRCDAVLADALPLPESSWLAERRQRDGDGLLRTLENRLPGGAVAYVGLCDEDLTAGELNFVYGVASPARRTGVWSLHRLGGGGVEDDGDLLLRRTLKVMTHEIGHLLGMEHCLRGLCLMNGSNHAGEMDRTPLHLCPECEAKLLWNGRLDGRTRWEGLAAAYDVLGFAGEADFARRRLAR